jgi:Rrf2 family protein
MRISTKGRYALQMMVDLAEHKDEGFIPLKEIAARQSISKNYLEQIVGLFKNTAVLKSERGHQGGYKLAKSPEMYTVRDILRFAEGSVAPIACLDNETNECGWQRQTLCLWSGLEKVISDYLNSITLQDILDGKYFGCNGE